MRECNIASVYGWRHHCASSRTVCTARRLEHERVGAALTHRHESGKEQPMNQLTVSTWAVVNEGCLITCSVSGSNLAHLMIGDHQLELNFDAEALRALVTNSTAALAEMDALF